MLVRADPGTSTLYFDGRPLPARQGDTVAVALLAAGIRTTRKAARSGQARGPYCMMGACFECLATVDGVANVQTCLTLIQDGMRVEPQAGVPAVVSGPESPAETPGASRRTMQLDLPA